MSDGSPVRPHRRRPFGMLGMLALVCLFESAIASQPLHFTDVIGLSRIYCSRAATRMSRGKDVLFLGDSMVKLGLLPKVFHARTGRTAFNLAAVSSPAPVTYFTLRRALEAGAKPGAIVVDFGPGLLAAGPERDVKYWGELLGPREFVDLAWSSRDPSFAVTLALHRLMPSVRGRFEIRDVVRTTLAGATAIGLDTNRACQRNWLVNHGAQAAAKNLSDVAKPAASGGSEPRGRPRVDPVNSAYVDRILTLAKSRGIQVFWLLPPVRPDTQERRERRGIEPWTTRFVQSTLKHHPEVTILDARHSGYDTTRFADSTHLHAEGAITLTSTVADQVTNSNRHASHRWVILPPPGSISPDRLVEDLDRSRTVVAQRPRHATIPR